MKSKYKILICLVSCLLPLAANSTHAAKFEFSALLNTAAIGQFFEVSVFLDSESQRINAVQGNIIFPADILDFKEIHDGNSVATLWVEQPHLASRGSIFFSGIIPGGYVGVKGFLFSFVVKGSTVTNGLISAKDAKAFLNDGLGTEAKIKVSDFSFTISEAPIAGNLLSPADTVSPESFSPSISNDQSVFDGKWFLIFNAQDKGTGIDHYEVKEGGGQFVEAQSPYLLKYQALDKDIAVKAIDRAGNSRTSILPPRYPQPWYKQNLIWIIIVLSLIILIFFRFKKRLV
ncbi:MAG: hypothetical protein HY432_01135 [Candidatus Liptonbacteria bacterium]|nr:hypothetical protein [Candidatus Liptonbacteria bacterium]